LPKTKKARGIKLYFEIYKLLITGHSQKQICKFLQIDKGNLSRKVSKIENAGYVQCIVHGRSKFYAATKKPFKCKNVKELYKVASRKEQRLHGGCKILQIQNATFKCKIQGKIHKPPGSWDKSWNTNGLQHDTYTYPFKELNGAHVTFIRNHSSKTDLLKIRLPRIDWVITEINPEEYLEEIAKKLAIWYQKQFRVKLDLDGIKKSGKIEYALVIRDPDLINAAQNDNYKVGEVWIDTSKPHELAELESNSYEIIKTIADLEDRSSAYQDIKYLKSKIYEIESNMVRMMGLIESLQRSQEQITELLQKVICSPIDQKSDTFIDVV